MKTTLDKQQILDQFTDLVKHSYLSHKQIADHLGIHTCYIDWCTAKNHAYRDKKFGTKPLKTISDFLKSGKKIEEYKAKIKNEEFESMKIKKIKNEVINERLAERFLKAIEGTDNWKVGNAINVSPEKIAMVRNPRAHKLVSQETWDKIKLFINSGRAIGEYCYLETKQADPQRIVLDINITINGKKCEISQH